MADLVELFSDSDRLYCWDKEKKRLVVCDIREVSPKSLPEDVLDKVMYALSQINSK